MLVWEMLLMVWEMIWANKLYPWGLVGKVPSTYVAGESCTAVAQSAINTLGWVCVA